MYSLREFLNLYAAKEKLEIVKEYCKLGLAEG